MKPWSFFQSTAALHYLLIVQIKKEWNLACHFHRHHFSMRVCFCENTSIDKSINLSASIRLDQQSSDYKQRFESKILFAALTEANHRQIVNYHIFKNEVSLSLIGFTSNTCISNKGHDQLFVSQWWRRFSNWNWNRLLRMNIIGSIHKSFLLYVLIPIRRCRQRSTCDSLLYC